MFGIYICAAITLICAGVVAGILALAALGKRSPSSVMDWSVPSPVAGSARPPAGQAPVGR